MDMSTLETNQNYFNITFSNTVGFPCSSFLFGNNVLVCFKDSASDSFFILGSLSTRTGWT